MQIVLDPFFTSFLLFLHNQVILQSLLEFLSIASIEETLYSPNQLW
jgi:hypothetical protein